MYATAVERSGGEPVEVPRGLPASALEKLAETCQGYCLPGSPADVNPAYYAADVDPAIAAADPAREACDFFLLEHAQKHGKPVLAICFGMQALNAWRGGTLVQDLLPMPVNHSAGSKVAVAHTVLIPQESTLGDLFCEDDDARAEAPKTDGYLRLPVNTSHHQAVGVPGEGLRIVARCPEDGVIESVENDAAFISPEGSSVSGQFLLGVQWHPERSYDISAASRMLFNRLVQAAALQL